MPFSVFFIFVKVIDVFGSPKCWTVTVSPHLSSPHNSILQRKLLLSLSIFSSSKVCNKLFILLFLDFFFSWFINFRKYLQIPCYQWWGFNSLSVTSHYLIITSLKHTVTNRKLKIMKEEINMLSQPKGEGISVHMLLSTILPLSLSSS